MILNWFSSCHSCGSVLTRVSLRTHWPMEGSGRPGSTGSSISTGTTGWNAAKITLMSVSGGKKLQLLQISLQAHSYIWLILQCCWMKMPVLTLLSHKNTYALPLQSKSSPLPYLQRAARCAAARGLLPLVSWWVWAPLASLSVLVVWVFWWVSGALASLWALGRSVSLLWPLSLLLS